MKEGALYSSVTPRKRISLGKVEGNKGVGRFLVILKEKDLVWRHGLKMGQRVQMNRKKRKKFAGTSCKKEKTPHRMQGEEKR